MTRFAIRGLRPGAYFLRVTLIGFRPHRQEFTIAAASPTYNVGTIAMSNPADWSRWFQAYRRFAVHHAAARGGHDEEDVALAVERLRRAGGAVAAEQAERAGVVRAEAAFLQGAQKPIF